MGRRKKIIENLLLEDFVTEGQAIGRQDGKVYFVTNGVPGDVANVLLKKNKKDYGKGSLHKLISPSEMRIEPFCAHFEWCGGCKWQYLSYANQLIFKQKIVTDTLKRLGKIDLPKPLPIIGAQPNVAYRNKMEYSFSNTRWLTPDEIASDEIIENSPSVGLHVPGFYDKIVDIEKCYLQDEFADKIRNEVKRYALEKNISFINIRTKEGFIRSMFIRNSTLNEWMVNMVFNYYDKELVESFMQHLVNTFPEIDAFHYMINEKLNDTVFDLECITVKGPGFITEQIGHLKFQISPLSFFQTNSYQAKNLYDVVKSFANLSKDDLVYDLYSGTGTIGMYLANNCKQVIGIESNADSVKDAFRNAKLNDIENVDFYDGEVRARLQEAIANYGKPDVAIIDPPRVGLHKDAIEQLIELKPKKIVYVSCNPATQARDLNILDEHYTVKQYQPVDMFPHTYHIENVAELILKQ